MRKLTNEETKYYHGGWGCFCSGSGCGWCGNAWTQTGLMLKATAHAGLGHVVHCYVDKKFYDKHKGNNPNLRYY